MTTRFPDNTTTIFVDDVSMWSSLATATKQIPEPWKFDETMLRTEAKKAFDQPIKKIVFSSSLFDHSHERHLNPITNRCLRERHQLSMVGAMIEELYLSMIENSPTTFVIFTGHGNLCDTLKRCLQLGVRVHVIGVSGAISIKITNIQDLNFTFSYLPNLQSGHRLCKWVMAHGVPGNPVRSTSKWPRGCAAHLRGMCNKLHPGQPGWQSAVELWMQQQPSDERNVLKKNKEPTHKEHRCKRGFYCKTIQTCPNFHSDAQIQYFENHQMTPVLRKHVRCIKQHPHLQSQGLCGYLHPNEIRLCLWCNKHHEPDCFF